MDRLCILGQTHGVEGPCVQGEGTQE